MSTLLLLAALAVAATAPPAAIKLATTAAIVFSILIRPLAVAAVVDGMALLDALVVPAVEQALAVVAPCLAAPEHPDKATMVVPRKVLTTGRIPLGVAVELGLQVGTVHPANLAAMVDLVHKVQSLARLLITQAGAAVVTPVLRPVAQAAAVVVVQVALALLALLVLRILVVAVEPETLLALVKAAAVLAVCLLLTLLSRFLVLATRLRLEQAVQLLAPAVAIRLELVAVV